MSDAAGQTSTDAIRFLLNGKTVTVDDVDPTKTVLLYLRENLGRSGTKEGCAEGDCGACTIVTAEVADDGELALKTVNACVQFVPTLDGKALFTVEDLRQPDGRLHPVQQSMVEHHGSQCGFCTPGFIMSLWNVYNQHQAAATRPDETQLRQALTGNLCRCTGYRPILEAATKMFDFSPVEFDREAVREQLLRLRRDRSLAYEHQGHRFFAPRSLQELVALRAENLDATILAGGTDIGKWVNKRFRETDPIIHIGEVRELRQIRSGSGSLRIGAGVSLTDAQRAISVHYPEMNEMWERFGSVPIRNAGTLGGNVVTGSPIGDSMPALIVLGAEVVLRSARGQRTMPLEALYSEQMKNAVAADEIVEAIELPLPTPALRFRCYKLSKRYDSDISTVFAAFAITLNGERLAHSRVAFGGMAATPKRARRCEQALTGKSWNESTARKAMKAMTEDYTPMSDMRASGRNRMQSAQNLLYRFYLETRPGNPLSRERVNVFAVATGEPGTQPAKINSQVHAEGDSQPHESARLHVSGEATYVDDIKEVAGTLYAALGLSERPYALVKSMDLSAVENAPGVVAVVTAQDIPGENDCGPIVDDDPILADGLVQFVGQPMFAVVAESHDAARRAVVRAKIKYEDLPPILTPQEAKTRQSFVVPPMHLQRGEPAQRLAAAPRRTRGELYVGGQEHFYLEGQISYAIPKEDDGMLIYCSTQYPTEMQRVTAHALNRYYNQIVVETRRMGGGFGGKETQSALFACVAAICADRLRRPVKLRLDRDDDFLATGKRHCFHYQYDAGFDNQGRIVAAKVAMVARAGFSSDLSAPVATRAVCHFDNAYYLSDVDIRAMCGKTNTQSNTAFRGFGGPQGAIAIEYVIDNIARELDMDPLDVRKINFYGREDRNTTPYGQVVEDNVIHELVDQLERSSDYASRRRALRIYNQQSAVLKKGIALTPVKFGISFNVVRFNQAGALVHVYTDGSILVNHGGTEMGQGLNTKVAQVVAGELGVSPKHVRATATDTSKVANTSATAASTGADLNGKAAENAARQIRGRLAEFAASRYGGKAEATVFADDRVTVNGHEMSFTELVLLAYDARVQLWSDGFYKTPNLHWDRESLTGRPFFYYAYGAAVSEVVIDTLTGEWKLLRADLLHDAGNSINPAIDVGQVEGAFVQGLGWLTCEDLWWNSTGKLMTHAPSTYKIPAVNDCPRDLRVQLFHNVNHEDTILRSKAVGEPPLLLSFSVFFAIRDAIASVARYALNPPLNAPATPEAILAAVTALQTGTAPGVSPDQQTTESSA